MRKLVLIDGNAIIHRAYHAMPHFRTKKGELVNAVYGFASMLLNILLNEKPDYVAISFDRAAKTFRHEKYEAYKATRIKAPDDLYAQIPRIKELVKSFQIPIYEIDGFEADDVLGTLSRQAEQEKDIRTYIATGDKDTFQLISDRTFVMTPFKGFKETIKYDHQKIMAEYGIEPSQITDLKGLMGDASDNIPGILGIGKKTATKLLQKYKSVERIYENLHEIGGAIGKHLAENKKNAFFSKELATIIRDIPVKLDLRECETRYFDYSNVQNLFVELEFKSLLKKLENFKITCSQQCLF